MRADRLISLLLLLQTRGQLTARELASELEVSERTIYRDLDALSVAGIPVYAERGPQGGIALLDNYRTSLTGLTTGEVTALFTAIIADPTVALGASSALRGAVLKVMAALPAHQQNQAEAVRQRIHLDPAAWFQMEEPTPYLSLVQQAIWETRRLRMVYRRADGGWITRLIAPYALVAKASIWYVVSEIMRPPQRDGRPYQVPAFNVYRVSRIQEASLAESSFERWSDFDLPAYWREWCRRFEDSQESYPVTLRVHLDHVADLVGTFGEGVHQLAAAAGSPDIHGYQTLQFHFATFADACRALVGLGDVVQLLSPPELKQGVIEWARRLLTHYS